MHHLKDACRQWIVLLLSAVPILQFTLEEQLYRTSISLWCRSRRQRMCYKSRQWFLTNFFLACNYPRRELLWHILILIQSCSGYNQSVVDCIDSKEIKGPNEVITDDHPLHIRSSQCYRPHQRDDFQTYGNKKKRWTIIIWTIYHRSEIFFYLPRLEKLQMILKPILQSGTSWIAFRIRFSLKRMVVNSSQSCIRKVC